MFTLTLNYDDNTTFFVGGFNTMDELNAWLNTEKTRPYYKETTTSTIVEIIQLPITIL